MTRMSTARYIYICSAGHSGSTLLDLLLGSHPRITSLGELSHLSKNVALDTPCSCGTPVRACPFWRAVLTDVGHELGVDVMNRPYSLHLGYPLASTVIDTEHQTWLYLVRRKLVLGLYFLRLHLRASALDAFTRGMSLAIDNTVRVYDAARSRSDSVAVVDSSKSYLKAVALYRRHPDRVRILLLTRDGRAVLWSNLKRGTPRPKAVGDWRRQYARAWPLLERHVRPEHMMQVRYEDIAGDTRATLLEICRFVGIPYEEAMLNFRTKTHHIANGNRMRLSTSSEIVLDDAWKSMMPASDIQYFDLHAGSLNRELGYP